MKNVTYSVVVLVCWSLLTACGGPVQVDHAPNSQEEAASEFIIKSSSKQDAEAVIAASSSYRVLSVKHNIYTVKGLDYATIKAIAPSVSAQQNLYIEPQSNRLSDNPYSKFVADSEANQPPVNLQPPQQQNIPPALLGCDLQSEQRPLVKLSVINGVLSQSPTMNLGETVVFSSAGSLGGQSRASIDPTGLMGPIDGGNLSPSTIEEVRWEVITPSGSKISKDIRKGLELEVTPDMVGLYTIAVVVQDADKACDVQLGRFMVTHNPEIELAKEGDAKPMAKLEAFTHLARIQAQQAWELATGQGVTIAVLDTGLHYNHLGIKFNLAVKNSERFGQADSDDDGNGFPDDILGWDFINNDNKPFDDEGHGSHVSGLAASHIHGVAKDAKILPVKVMAASGGGDVASVIAGVYYAVDNGAQVINASLGGFQSDIPAFQAALQYAHDNNVVFISASGNSRLDLSLPGNDIYPGELDVPNLVNVAAVGVDQNLASYSNFGLAEVDVAAPGGDRGEPLYSLATLNPENVPFIGQGGTSMAAPVVAGVAALMIDANPSITPVQIRRILMSSGTQYAELDSVVGSGRVLSALEAVQNVQRVNIQSNQTLSF